MHRDWRRGSATPPRIVEAFRNIPGRQFFQTRGDAVAQLRARSRGGDTSQDDVADPRIAPVLRSRLTLTRTFFTRSSIRRAVTTMSSGVGVGVDVGGAAILLRRDHGEQHHRRVPNWWMRRMPR